MESIGIARVVIWVDPCARDEAEAALDRAAREIAR